MKRLHLITAALLVTGLTAFGCATLSESAWVTLIDGDKGFENFNRVGDANWRAEDGAIVADKGKGGFLVSKKSYANFEIRAEFWAGHDANSGIYMRCQDPAKITDRTCYEANVFDQRPDPTFGTGALQHLIKASPMLKVGGSWSTYVITVKDTHLRIVLNGVETATGYDSQFANGPVALQFGNRGKEPGGVIKFRKVQIREL